MSLLQNRLPGYLRKGIGAAVLFVIFLLGLFTYTHNSDMIGEISKVMFAFITVAIIFMSLEWFGHRPKRREDHATDNVHK